MPTSLQIRRFFSLVAVILVCALLRLLPHPPNFSPVTAIALFAGATFDRKFLALIVPLAALFISDLFIGFYDQMPTVYGSMMLVAVLGFALREKRGALRLGGFAITGSLLFFVTTNFTVWAVSGFYPKTSAGLLECYVAALPFLQNALAGDLLFTGVIFGAWAFVENKIPQMRQHGG